MWHIHISDERMSLLILNHFCQHVLRFIRKRVMSLRLTLTNIIGGWSLISSSLKYHISLVFNHMNLINY
jgi:hypothetical protein